MPNLWVVWEKWANNARPYVLRMVTVPFGTRDGVTAMGTWGGGIFDNDTSCEFLGTTCAQLVGVIRSDLAESDNANFERVTPAAVSILLAIVKHIPIS